MGGFKGLCEFELVVTYIAGIPINNGSTLKKLMAPIQFNLIYIFKVLNKQ